MQSVQRNDLAAADCKRKDRRSKAREKLVLRIGLIQHDERSIFCLVKNISSSGVQIKPFGRVEEQGQTTLKVGDEDPIPGTIVWSRDGLAGLAFSAPLHPQALLRIGQKFPGLRRRGAPRVSTRLSCELRTGTRRYSAIVCDLSMMGARIQTSRAIEFGETTYLKLGKLPSVRVFKRWAEGQELGLSFPDPLPIQVITDLLTED